MPLFAGVTRHQAMLCCVMAVYLHIGEKEKTMEQIYIEFILVN